MERLPEVIEVKGVGIPGLTAKLVMRTDKKAMYRRDNVYEVFRIKVAEAREAFGKNYPQREVYPGNEDFGVWAWCFSNEAKAKQRYDSI